MSNPYQEFLEYLDVQREIYRLDKISSSSPDNSYILKNKMWVMEDVIEQFLKRFGDRVDAEKSAREAEGKARLKISKRPVKVTITFPGDPEHKERPASQIVKPEDYSEDTKAFLESMPPEMRARITVYKPDEPDESS
ncbi:MAG TPA: hypothetical protein VF268_12740 [Gammaproteobacteria bacterium]